MPHPLRLNTFWDEKKGLMYFLTNNFKLAAALIASIYKERCQIELFFKAIKQNLKVKSFLGTARMRSNRNFGQHSLPCCF
jgi:IS4 transposase